MSSAGPRPARAARCRTAAITIFVMAGATFVLQVGLLVQARPWASDDARGDLAALVLPVLFSGSLVLLGSGVRRCRPRALRATLVLSGLLVPLDVVLSFTGRWDAIFRTVTVVAIFATCWRALRADGPESGVGQTS